MIKDNPQKNDGFKSTRIDRFTVLHLDHTRTPGGAEMALNRVVSRTKLWDPVIAVPRGGSEFENDVFIEVSSGIGFVEIGPRQTFGASNAGIIGAAKFGAAIVGQAFALRFSSAFREAAVVHANTSRSGLYGALACLSTRKPFVVHLRDMVDAPSLGRIGLLLFQRLVLPRANGVIGNSQATMKSAIKWTRKRAHRAVIASPSGFESRRRTHSVRETVLTVAMVARIDPWKGQRLLIEAFAQAFQGTEIRLRIAGAPAFGHSEYYEEIQTLAKTLGIGARVDFMGHVSNVEEFIDSADICVQASIRPEPLGQNVLQYLAAGKPTIVANEGGPIEWVSHDKNGLHFVARDRDSLARTLLLLSSDVALRKRLVEGTQEYNKVPTDDEISQRHGEFFDAVLNGAIRPS